jgi:hypothetical protein
VITYTHQLIIGASGAITSQDADSGIVATKQGTAGQYLLQFSAGAKRIIAFDTVFLQSPAAIANGFPAFILTDNLTAGSKNGQLVIQFVRGDTYAAADVANPSTIILSFDLAEGI